MIIASPLRAISPRAMLRLLCTQLLALGAMAGSCDFTKYNIGEDNIPRYPDVVLKWNLFASETGMYEVEGCDGPSPTIKLRVGVKYKFVQADISNWCASSPTPTRLLSAEISPLCRLSSVPSLTRACRALVCRRYHPVGFAYEPGGALNDCPNKGLDHLGNPPQPCPEVEQGLVYHIDDEEITSDESGYGLDEYEPFFKYPQDVWGEKCKGGGCYATLQVTRLDKKELYYFCHIHRGMSAKIEMVGYNEGIAEKSKYPELMEPVPKLGAFDTMCGTWGQENWQVGRNEACQGRKYLCGKNLDSEFNQCMASIDCKMSHDMAIETDPNPVKTFMRQMIPHHENAVAMAKILLKFATPAYSGSNEEHETILALGRDIINTQNAQITYMDKFLKGSPPSKLCYHDGGWSAPAKPPTTSDESTLDELNSKSDSSAAPVAAGTGAVTFVAGVLLGMVGVGPIARKLGRATCRRRGLKLSTPATDRVGISSAEEAISSEEAMSR